MNRVFKDSINTVPSNITANSIECSAQSVKQVYDTLENDTLENFDRTTNIHRDKGQHVAPDTSEESILSCRYWKMKTCSHLNLVELTVALKTFLLIHF